MLPLGLRRSPIPSVASYILDSCKRLLYYEVLPLQSSLYLKRGVTNRRLIASDSSIEGNRRDYSMSGNQISGKEGGVQCVMAVVCTLDIVCV